MGLLDKIGHALGEVGGFFDDQYKRYHFGDDYKEKEQFLRQLKAIEQETGLVRLQGVRDQQARAAKTFESAQQEAEMRRLQHAIGLGTDMAGAGLGEGTDTAGLPGSDLAGPPDPDAEASLASAFQFPAGLGVTDEEARIAKAVGGARAVRGAETGRRARAKEQAEGERKRKTDERAERAADRADERDARASARADREDADREPPSEAAYDRALKRAERLDPRPGAMATPEELQAWQERVQASADAAVRRQGFLPPESPEDKGQREDFFEDVVAGARAPSLSSPAAGRVVPPSAGAAEQRKTVRDKKTGKTFTVVLRNGRWVPE